MTRPQRSGSGGFVAVPTADDPPSRAARPGTILCECGAPAVIRCHWDGRLSCGSHSLLSCAWNPSHRWVPPIKEHGPCWTCHYHEERGATWRATWTLWGGALKSVRLCEACAMRVRGQRGVSLESLTPSPIKEHGTGGVA